MTKSCLESIRDDASFTQFRQKVQVLADKYDFGEPRLLRKRRAPCKLNDGIEPPGFPASAEDYFHPIFFLEAIDNVIAGLKDQFEQLGNVTYSHIEQLMIKACQGNNFSRGLTTELILNPSCSPFTLTSFDTASRSLAKKTRKRKNSRYSRLHLPSYRWPVVSTWGSLQNCSACLCDASNKLHI